MPPKKPIPIRRKRTADVFRDEALERLKNHWNQEEGEFDPSEEPVITPILKSVGIPKIIEALKSYDEDDARSFIEIYDELSDKDRQYLTLEEIAYASGIGSLRLAEISQTAMFLRSQMQTSFLLSAGIGKVVETMLKQASKPKGLADREWALKARGVLPMPKGAQINIPIQVNAEKESASTLPQPYLDSGERLRLIHEAVEPRRLPSPPSEPVNVGGLLDHMQAETAEILVERSDV